MEQIPDATIDVSGGSSALSIEGLGVKKRKSDLSSISSSTSQISMQEMFGDLLDQVNFTDSSSVDSFRSNAASRITEMDPYSLSSVVQTPLSTQQTQPSGFTRLFGEPAGSPSESTDSDFGTEQEGFGASYENPAYDVFNSDLTNPDQAAGFVGSLFGASQGSLQDFGMNMGSQAMQAGLGSTGRDAYGAFNASQSLSKSSITDASSALGAINTAITGVQAANSVASALARGKTLEDMFTASAKGLTDFVQGVWSAVTNPGQAMEAFGREMAYGTQHPDPYSFNVPGGTTSFTFDAKTGKLTSPGFINFMMGMSPLSNVFKLSNTVMTQTGYKDKMTNRALNMTNALSMPGINYGEITNSDNNGFAGISAYSTANGGTTTVSLDFTDVAGVQADVQQIDMHALDPNTNINDLTMSQINEASVIQNYYDWDEEDPLNQALQAGFRATATELGLDPNTATHGKMTTAIEAQTIELANEFEANFNLMRAQAGLEPFTSTDYPSPRTSKANAVADDPVSARGSIAQSAVDAVEDEAMPSFGSKVTYDPIADPYTDIVDTTRQTGEIARSAMKKEYQQQINVAVEAEKQEADALFAASYDPGGYNSPTPSSKNISIAQMTMEITGLSTVSPTRDVEALKTATNMYNQDLEERKQWGFLDTLNYDLSSVDDQEGSQGSFDTGFGDMSAEEAQEAYNQDPVSGMEETSDSDSDSDSKVICTALKDMGLLDKELWQHDGAYGETLPLEIRRGYWAWGVPTAKFIRSNTWAAKAIRPVVTETAKEMAYRVGYGKGSKLGAALLYVGLPMCRVISRIKNNGNHTRSVYS